MVKISRNELVPGDHIYSYRNAYVYSHHGIYVGEGQVIHYTRTDESRCSFDVKENCDCGFDPKKNHGVVKSCLECFLSGRKLRRVKYGFSSKRRLLKRPGTYSKENSHDAKTVLGRAEKSLKEKSFGKYNLIFNNCESFARYCMTENKVSEQVVAAGVALGGAAIGGAAIGGAGAAGVDVGTSNTDHDISKDRNNDDNCNDYDNENSEEEHEDEDSEVE